MPKKDIWVGVAEPDPIPTVDSAGSCDSVISNNSSSLEMVTLFIYVLIYFESYMISVALMAVDNL